MTPTSTPDVSRRFSSAEFDRVYDDVILGNDFFEFDDYYRIYRGRYRSSLEFLSRLSLPRPAKVLEVGGGQAVLLLKHLFGDEVTLADVNPGHASAVERFGLEFRDCDLLHDDLPDRDAFDLVVLLEVVEHLPVPLHTVLEKVKAWIKPGGWLFLTTPNLYRLRNAVRLALGMPIFCNFFYPERGHPIGHPLEYSAEHLRWQLDRAGFAEPEIVHAQLTNRGASIVTQCARVLMSPLLLRPIWRDSLVAWAQRPAH